MAALIHYDPTEIWDIFQCDKEKLRNTMKEIAENPDFDVTIFLTETDRGTQMFPNIVVYMEGDQLYEEAAVNEGDCIQTVRKIYFEYLTEDRIINNVIASSDKTADDTDHDIQDDIDKREDELDDAVFNFLTNILDCPLECITEEADEIYEDFKEHALEYLARKWDLKIFRPMILEDENGEEFVEDYPYDVMEYDDPDNPLYN